MISTGKGVEKILGRKGRRSGGKKANRDRGERSKEGEALRKGKASGGKGGKDLNRERGETILGRKGGGEDLREEREKIWEKRT